MALLATCLKVNALVDFVAVPLLFNGSLFNFVYPGLSSSAVSPFMSRTYAALVFALGCARLHGGLNLNEKGAYRNALWSYIIECVHFALEIFVFKTAPFELSGFATQAFLLTAFMVFTLTKNYRRLILSDKKRN